MPQPSTTRGGPSPGNVYSSVETSRVLKICTAEKLTLGSLPHVLKERALNSPVIACNINVSAGKRVK